MRSDGPAPSISGLFSSWLALTGWLCNACVSRVQSFAEGTPRALEDAVMDVGCPPRKVRADGDDLPPLDAGVFAESLRERAEEALRQSAELINAEPHACLAGLTRERVQALFAALADEAIVAAAEQRIAAAESARGETDPTVWVRRYRRMLAEEGKWPPAPEGESEAESHGEEVRQDA